MLRSILEQAGRQRQRSFAGALRWFTLALVMLALTACQVEEDASPRVGMTLHELALENARECVGIYTYPQALIDGLSIQLIDELRCMDPDWLEYYTPCKEIGCIWAYGPQPLAARPEVLAALRAAATSKNDYITLSAGYRDVAMQYFSRWFRENCNPNFHAAEPGKSNHQGGRAIDVQSYNYWNDTLLDHGFTHPIPNDRPHYELYGDSQFRAESAQLRVLSVKAFQVLWNKNHPDDQIGEDGIYGPQTKSRLGSSPIEGFPISGCEPVEDPCDTDPCATGCDPAGCVDPCDAAPCGAGCDASACDDFCAANPCDTSCPVEGCVPDCSERPCDPGCDPDACDDFCAADPCADVCPGTCAAVCEANPCTYGCPAEDCIALCDDSPCDPACSSEGCETLCDTNPCADQCVGYPCVPLCDGVPCPTPDPDPCRDETCEEPCVGDSCLDEPEEPDDDLNAPPGSGDNRVNKVTGGGGCASVPGSAPAMFAWIALAAILRSRRRR